MAFDFVKRLFSGPRRLGVVAFRADVWDNARGRPEGEWIADILGEVSVIREERAGGMVRVLCECPRFSPVQKGETPPQYFPRLILERGPDGESRKVEFNRRT